MTDVITGLSPRWESAVATTLESAPGVTVVRRCADVAELVAVAEAGAGQCAVLSADLRGLDLSVLRRLERSGLRVVALYPTGDEDAERRLRQLRLDVVLPVDAPPADFAAAVEGTRRPTDTEFDLEPPDSAGDPGGQRAQDLTDGATLPVHLPDIVSNGPHAGYGLPADEGWLPAGSVHVGDGDEAAEGPAADAPDRGVVVAVWGPTGAPGRTTVAVNLAAELASRGLEVLLVDADTYGGCVAQSLGVLDEAPGVAAACRAADHGTLDLRTLARLAPSVSRGLRVLTGLPKAERWPEVRGAALERVLELARGLSAVVVVDCGFCLENDEELSYDTAAPRRNEATLTALEVADTVLAVGGADPVALQRFVRGLQELAAVPSPPAIPVINRTRSAAVGSRPEARIADSLLRFAGLDGIRFLPDDPDVVDAALLAGRCVVENAPESPLRVAVSELATTVAPLSRSRSTGRRPSRRARRRERV